jgi:histidine triad (HIT) family protein
METIFTKIINGNVPSYKIAEDNSFYAFLDINPLAEGHTLVVPKHAIDYVFDIDDQTLGNMMIFAKKIAIAIKNCIPCVRVGVAIIGLEVPHAHIHLIPINEVQDINFQKKKLKLSSEHFSEIAKMIAKTVE